MTRKYGTPDSDAPELTDADFAAARAWRQGDPKQTGLGPVSSREVKRLRDALEHVVDAYEHGAPLDDAIARARAALTAAE